MYLPSLSDKIETRICNYSPYQVQCPLPKNPGTELIMKLLNTYEDKDEAEIALTKVQGPKRLASERDDTDVIYNLFGEPSWGNFYRLGMFQLPELQALVNQRQNGQAYDEKKHREIITILQYIAGNFELMIPEHWM